MLAFALLMLRLVPSVEADVAGELPRVEDAATQLKQAQHAFDELRLDEARVDVDRALRDPQASRTQLADAYRLQGVIEASLGQAIAARRAFSHMLVLQFSSTLSEDYAPKIRRSYDAARAGLAGEKGISLQSMAPAELPMEQAVQIALQLNDTLSLVEQIEVELQVGDAPPQHYILERSDRGILNIAAEQLPRRDQPYLLRFRAVARNAFGAELARLADDAVGAQVSIVQELSDPTPWYQRWWIWAGVAGGLAAVASATAITAALLVPADSRPRDIAVVVQ